MKYYDTKTKQFCTEQNKEQTRIPYPNGLIEDLFNRAANGERVSVEDINIPNFFDKDLITKNLLYIELKYLVKNKGDNARIDEIKAILSPPEEETQLQTEEI